MTKITNAKGRSDYISKQERQEEIVLHQKEMKYDWEFYSLFEKEKSNSDKVNNEAREIIIALPNELSKNRIKLKQVCDELKSSLLTDKQDYEYAVHWNKARTNLHMHLLFSEREVLDDPVVKTYKKDQWRDKDTQKLCKTNAENGYLYAKKGEIMRDKEGNVRYESDPLSIKNVKFVEKSFIKTIHEATKEVFNQHHFEIDTFEYDSPYFSQKKLYKGASQDYLNHAKRWNDTVKEYNANVKTHIQLEPEIEPTYVHVRKELEQAVKKENSNVKKITVKAIEIVGEMNKWVKDQINRVKLQVKTFLYEQDFLKSFEKEKETLDVLRQEKEKNLEVVQASNELENNLNFFIENTTESMKQQIETYQELEQQQAQQIEQTRGYGRSL